MAPPQRATPVCSLSRAYELVKRSDAKPRYDNSDLSLLWIDGSDSRMRQAAGPARRDCPTINVRVFTHLGQKAKFSLRANVFRYSPDSRHSSGHAQIVLNHRRQPGMRDAHGYRHRRSLGHGGERAGWRGHQLLHDRMRQYPLGLADLRRRIQHRAIDPAMMSRANA